MLRPDGARIAMALLVASSPLVAHHILGIPHYAYDERYPQAPVITYRTEAGAYDVEMTGYPGRPVPGQRTSLHVYVVRRRDGVPLNHSVTLEVRRDPWIGDAQIVYGPVTAGLSESLFKFFPTFDREAEYVVRVGFMADGAPWTIDLPMVVGEPGSPVLVIAAFATAITALVIVVRAIRIKQRRREEALLAT